MNIMIIKIKLIIKYIKEGEIIRIGVFDSGIGGVNVLKSILKKYPNNTYIYYGDTLNIPYGEKDKETLIKLGTKIIKFLETKNVDIIIIACGTMSSNCMLELKKITKLPIYDIITPTINYINSKNYQKIGVFGTFRTIDSHVFKDKIKGDVKEIATSEFVSMVENNKIDSKIIKKYIDKVKDVEVLVLGCTHYPSLTMEFKKYLNDVEIIDMGVILSNSLKLENNSDYKLTMYFTKINDNLIKNINNIIALDYEIKEV